MPQKTHDESKRDPKLRLTGFESAVDSVKHFCECDAAVGVRFAQESLVLSVNALNLFDAKVQQHVWGDFIDRRIYGQVSYRF